MNYANDDKFRIEPHAITPPTLSHARAHPPASADTISVVSWWTICQHEGYQVGYYHPRMQQNMLNGEDDQNSKPAPVVDQQLLTSLILDRQRRQVLHQLVAGKSA
jgi:hypothetical protein